jgi:hypothetical protein
MPIEFALRVLFYMVIGFMLVVVIGWYVRSVYKSFFSSELVIAPFQVIGQKEGNEQLSAALADMLQARLTQIQYDLKTSQDQLLPAPVVADDPQSVDPRMLVIPRPIILSGENTQFEILNPPNINVSVGGVEVGGFFPWIQRLIVKEQMLRFSVYREGDKAVIAGDLSSFLKGDNNAVWIETERGTPDEIANSIAYELIYRKLSETQGLSKDIRALDSGEFRSLLTILFELAELNQRVFMGRVATDRYAELFVRLEKIAVRVPQWYELIKLTAKVAERAENNERAIFYYEGSLKLLEKNELKDFASDKESIEKSIEALKGTDSAPPIQNEQSFLESARRYAKRLELPQPEPKITFVKSEISDAVYALWNDEKKQYEINPERIDTPGLPEYAALQARFMAKNFEKCFKDAKKSGGDPVFWNDFRNSMVDYIISTEPDGSRTAAFRQGFDWQLLKVLKQIEKNLQGDSEPVRKLALALLDQYECGWTKADFLKIALAVNQEAKIISDEKVIEDAVAAVLKN